MARYRSPWDGKLKVSTALFLLVAAGLTGWVWFQESDPEGPLPAPVLLVPALLAAIAALAWALAPRGFSVEAGRVRVERHLLPVEIPLREVRAAEVLPEGALRASVRLWGSGGLFGYYGRFWSKRLGRYRLYATRASGLVRLATARDTWVFSPEPPARFVEEVLARAPAVPPGPEAGAAGPAAPRRPWLLPVGLATAVGLGLAAVMAASWAWAPRSVAVAGGEVVIERCWAGPERIPLSTVTEVRPLGREDFRGWRRVSGVALFGQASYGRYRSDALGRFQLYAWRRGPHVLLVTTPGKVVVTPDDWQAFVAEVRAGLRRDAATR
jgi:hypothetical protein